MIKIIKFIIFCSIGFIFYSDKLGRYTYRLVFNNFILQLKVLPIQEVSNFFSGLFSNNLTDNSILGKITIPLGLNWRNLCDTNVKKFYLLTVTSIFLIYRFFFAMKNFLLLPFKLGIFSFLFSIFGFYVTGFLKLFNIFYLNIPQWVYIQYLLLYSNWMNWWYDFVKIRSLNTSSLPSANPTNKENLDLVESTNNEPDNKIIVDKKRFIIALGAITLTAILIWYYFYSDFSGSNNIPPDNPEITISDNQTSRPRIKHRLRRAAESQPNSFQFNRSLYKEPSGSSLNRFGLLDTLDQLKKDGPPSPTNSNTSTETVTPTVRDVVYNVYESSRKKK